MRLRSARKPMRQVSDKQRERQLHLRRVKIKLLQRAKNACEVCSAKNKALDGHHPWGRVRLGPTWTDTVEAMAVVCRPGCHEILQQYRDPAKVLEVQEAGRQRLLARLPLEEQDRLADWNVELIVKRLEELEVVP